MHFSRDNYYADASVFEAGNELLKLLGKGTEKEMLGLLEQFRLLDKTSRLNLS